MKTGIIMERHRHFMIVFTNDGQFIKVNNMNGVKIGEEISSELFEIYQKTSQTKKKQYIAYGITLVALLIFAFIPLSLFYTNASTYALVNIDVNPSLEIELDRELSVKKIKPLNVDAALMMDEFKLNKGLDIESFLIEIINICEEKEYLNENRQMLVGISYLTKTKKHEKEIEFKITNDDHDNWEIITFRVPNEIRKIAKKTHRSMNKVLANQIEKSDGEMNTKLINNYNVSIEKQKSITAFYKTLINTNEDHSINNEIDVDNTLKMNVDDLDSPVDLDNLMFFGN